MLLNCCSPLGNDGSGADVTIQNSFENISVVKLLYCAYGMKD